MKNEKQEGEEVSAGRSQKVSDKNIFYILTVSIDDSGHGPTEEAQKWLQKHWGNGLASEKQRRHGPQEGYLLRKLLSIDNDICKTRGCHPSTISQGT